MRDSDRPLGVVYTPREVAAAMVELVLAPLVAGKSADEILALRVCDPAIGEGVFLVEVVRVLADAVVAAWRRAARTSEVHDEARVRDAGGGAGLGNDSFRDPHLIDGRDRDAHVGDVRTTEVRRNDAVRGVRSDDDLGREPSDSLVREARARVAAQCIVGVDIDARAVEAARAELGARGEALRVADATSLDFEAARAELGARGEALRVADATSLDWAAAFPDVFARGGFDVVVGNPPYIRQERLGSKQLMRGYASYHGVADLYVYFIELAHRVLRPRGRFCLIVPNKWLTVAYARALRGFLAEQASVEGVVDLSRVKLFADADAFPCIVWGTVGTDATKPIMAARPEAETPVEVALRETVTPNSRTAWATEPWHIEVASERGLLERMEKRWPRLAEVVTGKPARGVVTGCNRAFVIDRATRDALVAMEPKAHALIRPFVKGRDVRRWRMEAAGRWILLIDRGTQIDALPAVREHLSAFREVLEPKPPGWSQGAWKGRKPGVYAWHELQDPVGPLVKARGPRLLFQDIQTSPACALDETGELAPDTTVWMLPTADRVVLALLNSKLYGWYAKRRFPPALNGAVRPKLAYMRALPVAEPSAAARREIEGLVERRLTGDAVDDVINAAIFDLYEVSLNERRAIADDR